jgi:signal transduction histidine kinase
MQKHFYLFAIYLSLCISTYLYPQASKSAIDSVNGINYESIVADLDKSSKLFSDNLEKARAIIYPKGEGVALSNLALVHYLKGNYDKSTQYHIEAIKIFSDNRMYKELSDEYGEFGYQLKRRDLKKAVAYMQLAMKTSEEHSVPKIFRSKLYDNYGVLKEMQNDADSAIMFYKRALEIKKANHDTIGIPYSLNKIAVLKATQGKFSDAFKYLDLSDSYRNKEAGNFGRMENLSFRGDFLKLQNRIDDAVVAFEKALQLAKEVNYAFMILYCYENLTDLYKQKKQFDKALEYHLKYSIFKDSLTNSEVDTKVAQLEIAYETEQKNKLIAQKEFDLKSKTQQLTFTIITLILLLILIFAVYKYQSQKRKRAIGEIEFKNQIKNAELEKKLVSEKLNISRELHDNIGSQLTFLISSLDNITYSEKSNSLVPRLNALKNFSKDALTDLRSTIWAMKQEDGDLEKLVLRINETAQKLNSTLNGTSIEVINNIDENLPLNSTIILNLFRIIQEALQNAVKYSGASRIIIEFNKIVNGFELKINDNGNGFNINSSSNGNGLHNMKTRCEQSGGKFILMSSDTGTTISCQIITG